MVDWFRAVSAIVATLAVLAGAVLYIASRGDQAFEDLQDPRFPWNSDKQIVLKRISDSEGDIEKLVSASEAQRDSIASLQTATQNVLQAQRELTEAQGALAQNLDKHLLQNHRLYFQGENEEQP